MTEVSVDREVSDHEEGSSDWTVPNIFNGFRRAISCYKHGKQASLGGGRTADGMASCEGDDECYRGGRGEFRAKRDSPHVRPARKGDIR